MFSKNILISTFTERSTMTQKRKRNEIGAHEYFGREDILEIGRKVKYLMKPKLLLSEKAISCEYLTRDFQEKCTSIALNFSQIFNITLNLPEILLPLKLLLSEIITTFSANMAQIIRGEWGCWFARAFTYILLLKLFFFSLHSFFTFFFDLRQFLY